MINRTERLEWEFKIDKNQCEKHLDTLKDIPFSTPIERKMSLLAGDGGSFKTTYCLQVDYIGTICKALNAIVKLQEAGIEMTINENELNHGHCLLRDVFKSIKKLNKNAKKRLSS